MNTREKLKKKVAKVKIKRKNFPKGNKLRVTRPARQFPCDPVVQLLHSTNLNIIPVRHSVTLVRTVDHNANLHILTETCSGKDIKTIM